MVPPKNISAGSWQRNPGLRNKIMIQSKCALIRDTEKTLYIDTTKKHIIESVENSMKRLKVDHLDSFLFDIGPIR